MSQENNPEILEKLREYDQHVSILCLECGYEGLMGVESINVPWYLTWWVIIPLCLTGIGLIPAAFLGMMRGSAAKPTVVCPNCDTLLG